MDYISKIKAFLAEIRAFDIPKAEKRELEYNDFALLLAAPQAMIKSAEFFSLPVVSISNGDYADRAKVKENLEKNYGITNYDDAISFLDRTKYHSASFHFSRFMREWKGLPNSDIDGLSEEQKIYYNKCKAFAEQFAPIVGGEYGFYGWDIAVGADICRECYSAGYFSEKAAYENLYDFSKTASAVFPNWEQFAVSFLCGGAYSHHALQGYNLQDTEEFFLFLLKYVRPLFTDEKYNVWNANKFFKPVHYFPHLSTNLPIYDDKRYGIVSNEVSVLEKPIGYFFCEKADDSLDSGWRFFSGDETEEYLADADNMHAFTLNVLCNYDNGILPFLGKEKGTVVKRTANGFTIET